MKLRTPQQLSIASVSTIALYALQYSLRNFPSYTAYIQPIFIGLYGISLAILAWLIWRYVLAYLATDFWHDYTAEANGVQYPIVIFEWYYHGSKMLVKIAGVDEEVVSTTTPFDFGLPAHISYVLNVEDLAIKSEEAIVELINETYLCEYELEEEK